MVREGVASSDMLDLYYKTHLFDAPHFFDSYCIYIEKDRAPEKQFYLPRRKQLMRCVQAIQDMEDGKLHTVGISLAPGVGKTTIAEFGLSWTMGKNPFLPNLVGSHNAAFLTGMYGEMLRILDARGEYRWSDVFPGLSVVATNAKDLMIGIGYEKKDDMRFKTLQFGSLGSQLAGRVRAANWMYLDDAAAVPWMARFRRNTTPDRVVWCQGDEPKEDFYWLGAPAGEIAKGKVVRFACRVVGFLFHIIKGAY